jgi:hypothetical protein
MWICSPRLAMWTFLMEMVNALLDQRAPAKH